MGAAFLIAGVAAALFAWTAVTRENPIYAALFTLLTLAGVAVEFALMAAPFLASMQILLYAGAIMVLFVFVIMLLSLKKEEHGEEPPAATKVFAAFVSGSIFMFLFVGIRSFAGRGDWSDPGQEANLASFAQTGVTFGSVDHFGRFLYGSSVVPFELVSVLVTAAVAAVVLLARRHAATAQQLELEAHAKKRHGGDVHPEHARGPLAPEPQALAASDIHTPSPAPVQPLAAGQEAHR